jgi:hypothetical protein
MSDSGQTYDQRERWNDLEEASRIAQEAHRSDIWTALPAIITAHDVATGTIKANPATKLKHVKQDGTSEWLQIPEVADVPLQYPGGGGASWTFPVKEGDEVLLVFSSRSIDKWHQEGGIQEQAAPFRMHDVSDGFAIPGFRSKPRKLSNISTTKAQLRTDDGTMVLEFDPVDKKITINSMANPVQINGDLHVSGDVVWDTAGTPTHAKTHKHEGVVSGGDQTQAPVPGS